MSDLFGCVPREAFRIFTGRRASAAEAAWLRLCAIHLSEMALENPDRDQGQQTRSPPRSRAPPLPLTAEAVSADHLYLKMREGGWLVEE